MTAREVGRFLAKEIKLALPPTIYFFCAFNLIAFTTSLLLHHYWFALTNFLLASALALIVGKVVLVTHKLRCIDRYRDRPLIWAILFKTVFYSLVVALVRMVEVFVHLARDDRGVSVAFGEARDAFTWHHFTAVQIWLFTCFLIYVTATEIVRAIGKERITQLLFHGAGAATKR